MRSKRGIVIALIAVLLVCMCSCSKIPTPTETADAFLTAIKEQDTETLATVYADDKFDLLDEAAGTDESEEVVDETGLTKVFDEQMLPKMLDFDYELSNEQIDGDKATVDVKFTTYKMGDAFTAFFSEYLSQALILAFSDTSEEELDAMATTLLSGKIADLDEKNFEKTATLSLSMKDDKWVVDEVEPASDVVDALTGGLVTAFNGMEDAMSAWEE